MRGLVFITLVLAASACRTLGRAAFKEPAVTLQDVRVVGLGVTGGELDVQLGVYNPNNYRLDTSRLSYRVFVADTIGLANGILGTRASVQATDSTTVRIPVSFTYAGLGMAARQLLQTGTVTYRVTGDVTVASAVGNFTVPFSATGRYSTMRR